MSTIPIEANISPEQLLRAVERLPHHELATFVGQVLALRARHAVGALPPTESSVLLQINATWSAETQKRYEALVAKRKAEQITQAGLQELIALTDEVEKRSLKIVARHRLEMRKDVIAHDFIGKGDRECIVINQYR